jgi:hypothetical protein
MSIVTEFASPPNVQHAIMTIARDIENSVGFAEAGIFYDSGTINYWEYSFLLGTDEPSWELSPRQLACRRRINTTILHSISELELFSMGIDVNDVSIARNGWRWNPRLRSRHVAPEKGLNPLD